jgi:hypothetical protein
MIRSQTSFSGSLVTVRSQVVAVTQERQLSIEYVSFPISPSSSPRWTTRW